MRDETLPLSYFETIYERGPDPWGFSTSLYEARKYDATLAALPRPRYGSAFEVGCSIGVFTDRLAPRCDQLLAVEPVETALQAAIRRNAGHPQVHFEAMFVPADWPDDAFDLVVLSEVLDYLGEGDLLSLGERLRQSLLPSGDVVLVHWLGKKRGEGPKPSESSAVLIAATRSFLRPVVQQRNESYRLDVLTRFA